MTKPTKFIDKTTLKILSYIELMNPMLKNCPNCKKKNYQCLCRNVTDIVNNKYLFQEKQS